MNINDNPPGYDPKKDAIELVPYNPEWPAIAGLEIKKLRSALPEKHIIDLQHVGSTAIPGMIAKPVIDIQIAVDSLAAIKLPAIEILTSLGYIYWDKNPDKERMLFIKGMPPFGEKRSHHVHIVEPTSKHWLGKILFRDYLVNHPEIAHEYANLKLILEKQYKYDREKYTNEKTDFVNHVIELANEELEIKKDKVPIPDGELYFESTGTGKPLILIHAGFSDRRDWNHQIEDFGKKFNTIIYDQRGSGNSSVLTGAFSPADDLKALMDYLKIEKAMLVGHSLGGTIAVDFALQYPEKVSALVLIASGLNGYVWSKEYLEWIQAVWSVPQPEIMTPRSLSASFYTVAMSKPNIKAEIEIITQENFQKILNWKTFDINDVRWFFSDHASLLKGLKIPTLILYGDKDSEDIKDIAKILSKNIPDNKIMQMRNVDHLLNFENPDEFNSLVLDFVSKL